MPYLSGQHADYLALQLSLWKQGVRKNDPMNVMAAIAEKMSDEDIRAVSDYYARVRPLENRAAAGAQIPGAAPAVDPSPTSADQRSQAGSGAQPAATPDTPGG